MIESKLCSIFPTPVYTSNLNRPFTKKEKKLIEESKINPFKNEGNLTSVDNYILNRKEFFQLKKDLDLYVKDYFDKIVSTDNNIQPYITQSWLNYTETNQYHHKHEHPNSLISGVFYIDCLEEQDKITFFKKDYYSTIKFKVKDYNMWNSDSWWFSVKTGDIILFPSSLTHMVETKQGTNTRTSLAFNVFVKGTIGENTNLTELILK